VIDMTAVNRYGHRNRNVADNPPNDHVLEALAERRRL
jgi:hypothetical protein